MEQIKIALNTLSIDNSVLNTSNLVDRIDFEERLDEIKKIAKKRYRRLVKIYHPDKSNCKDSIEFRQIDESYKLINKLRVSKNNSANIPQGSIGILISPRGLKTIDGKLDKYSFSLTEDENI